MYRPTCTYRPMCVCMYIYVCMYLFIYECIYSDYGRKYFDVKKRAFLRNYMRDFGLFYAKFSFVNHPRHNRCEIRAFALRIMRVFLI